MPQLVLVRHANLDYNIENLTTFHVDPIEVIRQLFNSHLLYKVVVTQLQYDQAQSMSAMVAKEG